MKTRTRLTPQSAAMLANKLANIGIFLLLSMAFLNFAHANEPVAGVIDTPVTAPSVEELKAQIRKEQQELAKLGRAELEERAKNGDRLAQVALSADFADEAQNILFSPDAANAAVSDALAWYSLAAQRGYPRTPSLDRNGVKIPAMRVVRNK